jgi:hypothetical protein
VDDCAALYLYLFPALLIILRGVVPLQVSYDDGMTERQYARHIERQQDMLDAEQANASSKADKAADTVFTALAAVVNSLQKIKREDGSLLAGIFLDKPPKAIYPDYYQLIAQPIALKQILQKLKKGEYSHFEAVEQDFALLCHNARTYNLDTSPVYADSETLRREFYTRAAPVLRRFGLPPVEYTPLPPFSHLIYSPEQPYRRVLSANALPTDDGDGDAMDVDGGVAPLSGKKGKAGGARRKRDSVDGDGAPGSAPAKKRARVSTSGSSNALADPYGGELHQSGSGLSLSLKKPPRLVLPPEPSLSRSTSENSLEDNDGAGNQLYLSLSLKGRK